MDLVDTAAPYFRWQSNTVWLKDPPAEYVEKVQEPVDVWGGLDDIRSKLEGDEYDNEYEVCHARYPNPAIFRMQEAFEFRGKFWYDFAT